MGERYDALATGHNLEAAWWALRAKRGGSSSAGSDLDLDVTAKKLVADLGRELRERRYAPEPNRRRVLEAAGPADKSRELTLPAWRDKVVQQALRQVIEPLFEPRFLDCSYAYRPRRGAQRAVRRVLHELGRARAAWIARGDVDDFFESIPHERLLAALAPVIDDDEVVELVRALLRNASIDFEGELIEVVTGVPTGSVLGPLLSNVYLHSLDQHLREHGICHVRYADDWVLIAQTRAGIEAAASQAEAFLRDTLALRLNGRRHSLARVEHGFPFLGFWISPGGLAVDRAKLDRVPGRLRELGAAARDWQAAELVARFAETAEGWQKYYGIVARREGLALLDRHLAERLASELAGRGLVEEPEVGELLRDFPWPGGDSLTGEELLRAELARQRERRRREAAAERAGRRARRRAKGLAAERSEVVVWRAGATVEQVAKRLVVRDADGVRLLERPWNRVRSLQIRGRNIRVTSGVLEACAEHDLPVSFVGRRGQPFALVHNPASLRVELLTLQLRASEGAVGREVAAALAAAKVRGQGNLLKYLAKYRRKVGQQAHVALAEAGRAIAREARRIVEAGRGSAADSDWRGGIFAAEGRAAEAYWRAVSLLVPAFPGRVQQAASDPVNAALNYGYGILYGRIEQAILRAGLHSGIGFLHKGGRGRAAFTFDLIEPFRAPVVDRTVLAMAARRERLEVDSAGRLTGPSRQLLAANVMERWLTESPYGGKPADYETILADQLQRMIRRLHGGPHFRAFVQRW